MPTISDLLPDLALWNHGAGIAPESWIFIEGRADHALAYSALFWPALIEFEGYVLRAPMNMDHLRGWEHGGNRSRQQIEMAMNAVYLDGIFPQDTTAQSLKNSQCDHLANLMVDMLKAKLACDFPQRQFTAHIISDEDDFGVTFHQV